MKKNGFAYKKNNVFTVLLQVLIFAVTFLAWLVLLLYIFCGMASSDKRPYVQNTFVTTLLETGELKFVARLHLSDEEITKIVNANSMEKMDTEINEDLIQINPVVIIKEHITEINEDGTVAGTGEDSAGSGSGNAGTSGDNTGTSGKNTGTSENPDTVIDPDGDGIDIYEVAGRTFYATMMVVYDPTRLSVSAKYPWGKTGDTLDKFVKNSGAVAGINGGLYAESGNTGGTPYGVVVSNGEILRNKPSEATGLVLIGLTKDGILRIEDLEGLTEADVETLVSSKNIYNAVCFQEEASDKNNHFVTLMVNGEKREMNGMGSGLNPRTAIGQRADGALLLLVTDGRGASGHLGASASDLIEIMSEYGAINAANLDGGSSSCMYYNGEYLMNSVTFYYANSSWNMPLALVVK